MAIVYIKLDMHKSVSATMMPKHTGVMTPHKFVKTLEGLSFKNVFNPYSDCCAECDREGAAKMRRDSLLKILLAAEESGVDSLWVGRDFGHLGGRRTGLAFTDDAHLDKHAGRWGVSVEKPTKDMAKEGTATVIWDILEQIDATVFLWNVFPLHPHESQKPFTNRRHNARERKSGEQLLYELISLLKPARLVAIGNDAASSLERLRGDREILRVRHPAHGGQNQFRRQMRWIYGFSLLPERL